MKILKIFLSLKKKKKDLKPARFAKLLEFVGQGTVPPGPRAEYVI